MRSYIFQFSQLRAVKLGLTLDEALILDYLLQFYNSGRTKLKYDKGKTYFYITYRKIMSDLPILKITTTTRIRQIVSRLEDLKLIEKHKPLNPTTTLYIRLTFDPLFEHADEYFSNIGQDSTLSYYIDSGKNEVSNIRFNGRHYIYENNAIDDKLIEKFGKQKFWQILTKNIRLVVTQLVYEMGLKSISINLERGKIIISHTLPEAVIQMNVYKLERAVVDSYVSMLNFIEISKYTKSEEEKYA